MPFVAAFYICFESFSPCLHSPFSLKVPALHTHSFSTHVLRGGHGTAGQAGERGYRTRALRCVISNGLVDLIISVSVHPADDFKYLLVSYQVLMLWFFCFASVNI